MWHWSSVWLPRNFPSTPAFRFPPSNRAEMTIAPSGSVRTCLLVSPAPPARLLSAACYSPAAGYDVPTLKKRGRPRLGVEIATVVAIRLDPELDAALTGRAEHDHTSRSDVVREALRSWLAST
jgi:hypothetical protein